MKYFLGLLACLLSQSGACVSTLNISQIAPGIYLHQSAYHWPDKENHGEIANIGFIIGEKCIAVIDSGGSPQQGIALRMAIKQVSNKPICYVINTHVHPDHIYGNTAFKLPGVQFIGHYNLARAMESRGFHYISRAEQTLNLHITEENFIPPDIQVKESMVLNLGNREIVLTAHPAAHTDNDLSIYDKSTNTLWLADLFFIEHIPVLDGNLKGWLSELNKLEKKHYNLVIPGHGKPVKDWPMSLQPQKAYLQNLVSEIRTKIKHGETIEQAIASVGVSAKNHWALFDEFHKKNVTIAYAELEWDD